MNEPFLAGQDLHHGPALEEALHRSLVYTINLDFFRQPHDILLRPFNRLLRGAGQGARTAVLDGYIGAGLIDDLTDDLAAGPDDRADLFGIDLYGLHLRRVRRKLLLRLGQDLFHYPENLQPALLRLLTRRPHDLRRNALDLDIHLKRGYALLGAGDLEVHVAQVILETDYIAQDRMPVILHNESHGDTGHGRLERHTRVKKRERRGADRGHGGGAG